jgi:hypothetical protein
MSRSRLEAGDETQVLEHRAANKGHAMKMGERRVSLHFDPTVLAEIMARHWRQNRASFTLNKKAAGTWLKASWWRPPGSSALELHWSRRTPKLDRR